MKKQNIKKRFWLVYHGGLMLFSIGASMVIKYKQTGNALDPTVIVASSTLFIMSACIGYLAIYMTNKAKTLNQTQINKMIIPALLIFYVAAWLIASLSITIGVFAWFLFLERDLSEFWHHLFEHELSFGSKGFFVWLMFFTVAFFYVLWQKSIKKEQKLREENLRYRYNSLKSQVNPHFLFNSLNTLSELVYVDAKKSDSYIQDLSSIYRYVLENEETDLIDLDKEIEFVKRYFNLQQVRDKGKIFLEIDIDGKKGIKIIPVSLQLLVENALKHNSMSVDNPLKIKISLSDDYVAVSNSVNRKSILESTPQKGLANLKNRTAIIMGKDPIISETDKEFTVKLPIQKQE